MCVFCLLSSGLVPLHNACSYGHFEVTEMLLKVNTVLLLFFHLITKCVCV